VRVLSAISLVLVICLCGSAAARQERPRVKIKDSEALAGPWEFASPSGVSGIFVQIVTLSLGPPSHHTLLYQECQFDVYHRYLGTTKEGWFATSNDKPEDGTTNFDGRHLRIHSTGTTELRPFDVNITFHPRGREWTGTWRRDGRTREVVLTRPRPPGFCQSPFCSDWNGEPNPQSRFRFTPGSLHIRESSDGVYTVWLDRTMSGSEQVDERDGEPLRVISLGKGAIALETTSPGALTFRYSGKLSFDHLIGQWGAATVGGLLAPSHFIHAP